MQQVKVPYIGKFGFIICWFAVFSSGNLPNYKPTQYFPPRAQLSWSQCSLRSASMQPWRTNKGKDQCLSMALPLEGITADKRTHEANSCARRGCECSTQGTSNHCPLRPFKLMCKQMIVSYGSDQQQYSPASLLPQHTVSFVLFSPLLEILL